MSSESSGIGPPAMLSISVLIRWCRMPPTAGYALSSTALLGHPFGRLSAFGDPDDRLAGGAPVGGERSRRFSERPYCPDDRLEPSVPEPLCEVRELGTVGFDDEEDGAPVLGQDRGFPDGGDE